MIPAILVLSLECVFAIGLTSKDAAKKLWILLDWAGLYVKSTDNKEEAKRACDGFLYFDPDIYEEFKGLMDIHKAIPGLADTSNTVSFRKAWDLFETVINLQSAI